MREDGHLSLEEINRLVLRETSASNDESLSNLLDRARVHLKICRACRELLSMHDRVERDIRNLGPEMAGERSSACPQRRELMELALGTTTGRKEEQVMEHVVGCDYCGPLFRQDVATFSDAVVHLEEAFTAGLDSARPEWRMEMALKLSRSARTVSTKRVQRWGLLSVFSWPQLVFGTATVLVVLLMSWWGFRSSRPASANELLAEAYTEHRTLEVRIPGAKYAPIRVERSGGDSNLDKPTSLLKAEALIVENLQRAPGDPLWLQAKGRADLLDGNYDSSIQALQRALEAQPDSESLLADLGGAYYIQAKSSGRTIDYGNAVDTLGKSLAKSPDNPVAVYNHALASEQVFLYRQAIDDWEHYLRLDARGGWADEARMRLAALQRKLQERKDSLLEPLLRPEQIGERSGHDDRLDEEMNVRIEEYLHVAITEWLPQAFPTARADGSPSQRKIALAALAEVLGRRHQDTWLGDVLSKSTGVSFPSAVAALAASIVADDRGDYSGAQTSAVRAAKLFHSAANPAGEIRAEAEEIYTDHLLWEGDRCLGLLRRIQGSLNRSQYGWIRAQMRFEQSNCANMVGDLGTYETAIAKGIDEAKIHDFPSLSLRGLGFESLSAASLGDANKGFALATKGLALFWSGRADLMKGYNLYYDLDAAADDVRLPNLQVALWREATSIIDEHPDVLQRAMAHRWAGNAAYLANMPRLAASEFAKASELFAASPQTAATTRDYMDAEVWLAQMEVREGEVERAAKRLAALEPALVAAPSFYPQIGYYSAEADIAMRRADLVKTESSLRSAVFLSEWALRSFPSEVDRQHWADQTHNAYRDVVEWEIRQNKTTDALEFWEWYRGADLRARERALGRSARASGEATPPDPQSAPPLPSPKVVAHTLPLLHDETIVSYVAFADGYAVWSYDDRGIFARWLPVPPATVQRMALRFERLCADPNSDLPMLRSSSQQLYKLLITPIEEHLVKGRTIVIEPDEFVAAVPWEALVDGKGDYLEERAAIVIAPGLYWTLDLKSRPPITEQARALVISVPAVPGEGLPVLADADEEAHAVAQKLHSVHLLEGDNATLSAIRQGIRGAAIFHFAGHAIASPQRSGLLLAERDPGTQHSRLVSAESFAADELAALQLAVLSACHSAANVRPGNSGTQGLSHSLLRARVPHVIASRWNVDSRETAEFMEAFYTHLLKGNTVASAMRSAELGLAGHKNSTHPYYWAAFELQGTT